MSKHAPGPWEYDPESCLITCDADPEIKARWPGVKGKKVCRVHANLKASKANARLIAAAPDLLEALKFVMTAHGEQLTTAFEQAQDAISKATGETP